MRQRADHQRFEQLANFPAVQQACESCLPPWLRHWKIPPRLGDVVVQRQPRQPTDLKSGGIKTVYWTENLEVKSIETTGGDTFYPTAAPGIWSFLLIQIPPLFGFVVPWGAVRAVGWVVAGFVQTSH